MRKIAIAGFMAAALAVPAVLAAQEPPGMPKPTKEHEWLHQLAGEWEAEAEVWAEPGKPPMKLKSRESVRRIGGFWIVSESEVTSPGMPFARALTLGYDPQTRKYVAALVDTNSAHIGRYEGSLDPAATTLTLEGEMPSPFAPGTSVRVREVIELKSRDQKVVTTSVQGEDGSWFKLVAVNAQRKK